MKKIFEFTVLWEGWECDSVAWVVEKSDGSRRLVMTNHGSPYEADPQELRDRIAEYQRVIAESEMALALIVSPKGEA